MFGNSKCCPQVWAMGLRAKPSMDVNETVTHSGKVPSADASKDWMNFFEKSNNCLSASLLEGVAVDSFDHFPGSWAFLSSECHNVWCSEMRMVFQLAHNWSPTRDYFNKIILTNLCFIGGREELYLIFH